MRQRSSSSRSPWWAGVVAVAVTLVLAAVAKVLLRRRQTLRDGSAYAPEPLTGDPASVDAADVVPV